MCVCGLFSGVEVAKEEVVLAVEIPSRLPPPPVVPPSTCKGPWPGYPECGGKMEVSVLHCTAIWGRL